MTNAHPATWLSQLQRMIASHITRQYTPCRFVHAESAFSWLIVYHPSICAETAIMDVLCEHCDATASAWHI